MSTILVVDDDPHIRELLRHVLEVALFEVAEAADGAAALALFRRSRPDLVLLDVMMPGLDGWTVCAEIKRSSRVPVILLTAKGESPQKVKGFELGADDYIVKPFDSPELVARVKALLRRFAAEDSKVAKAGRVVLDRERYAAELDGSASDLPRKEFELLFKLAASPGRTFAREELLDSVWGADFAGNERTLDVHVNRLRERFPEAASGFRIATIRGLGYRLESLPGSEAPT